MERSVSAGFNFASRVLLVSALFLSLYLFFPCSAQATSQDRKKIISSDLSKDASLFLLNSYSSGEDIINYFTVRQKLFSLPYEELVVIQERIKKLYPMEKLDTLLNAALSDMEEKNIALLIEGILINNKPFLAEAPFYEKKEEGLNITELKPYAERVYLYNLKLKYKKAELTKKEEELWINPGNIKKEGPSRIPDLPDYSLPCSLAGEANEIWSYGLRDDNLTDFAVKRQWIKKYQENAISPSVYRGTLIIRNEYRLFCLDLASSQEIWSFGNLEKSGHEFYHTFLHPHHNSYGYELLLADDMIFTELAGKLTALKLDGYFLPQLIWERDLGEYTACTKPVKKGDTLITGLINARGELWMCGFDCQNGILKWSTYIGSSSFLSPVCTISTATDNRVFIGTNHGLLVCLKPDDGGIIWLRKYAPKTYSLLDFWLKDYYKGAFLEEVGDIEYDTQFLEAEDGKPLYYKPRESDYLYILDSQSGEIRDEILIDSRKFYILRAYDDKIILLQKTNHIMEKSELKIIELKSGRQIYSLIIEGGPLRGVNYKNRSEILFKINDTIHLLKMDKNNVSHDEIYAPGAGWLLDSEEGLLFTAKGRTLSCLNIFNDKNAGLQKYPGLADFLEHREKIKNGLTKVLQSDVQDSQAIELKKEILSGIAAAGISLDDIFTIIINNLERLKNPAWNELIAELQRLYGDKVVAYQDINIKFNNFLYEAGLAGLKNSGNSTDSAKKSDDVKGKDKFFVRGERIFPLPIQIIKGPKLLASFLLLNNDQLICVNEAGNILWGRKVFYYNSDTTGADNIAYETDKARGRMFADDIEAYLYNDILIVNDRVNIIAMNMNDGAHVWSMTNKGRIAAKEKASPQLNKDSFLKKYGADREFLKDTMFYTKFIDNRIIITHGNKVYSVDPLTGYCVKYCELNLEAVLEPAVSGENIYLISYLLDSLKVLNKDLLILGDFPLDFIDNKDVWPEIAVINDYVILHTDADLFLLDGKNGALKNRLNISDVSRYSIEACNDSLLVIAPFQKLINYRLDKDALVLNWEFDFESSAENIIWRSIGRKSKYYFLAEKNILALFRKGGDYFMTLIGLETGKKIWESRIEGVKGSFYNLSNFQTDRDIVNFIISTGYDDASQNGYNRPFSYLVYSKLTGLSLGNGEIRRMENLLSMQSINNDLFDKAILIETENYLLHSVAGKVLKAERKK